MFSRYWESTAPDCKHRPGARSVEAELASAAFAIVLRKVDQVLRGDLDWHLRHAERGNSRPLARHPSPCRAHAAGPSFARPPPGVGGASVPGVTGRASAAQSLA